MQEKLDPRRQAMGTLNRCQGNLSHVTAENCSALRPGLPPFRGKQLLESSRAKSEIQKTGPKNSPIAKVGPSHKGQPLTVGAVCPEPSAEGSRTGPVS